MGLLDAGPRQLKSAREAFCTIADKGSGLGRLERKGDSLDPL
jgi:hypothetical protein